ncbi:MAG TPA: TetR/AcrR family transcriptional regulator [Polyangia bacterium]|nr:TetR/AcrR family transcriptional regulator [Polyangia bacterium]
MTLEGDNTRARLIAESRDLYLEQGFARFSLREVARRAGVSAGAVYNHYDGKEALLREVCGEGFRIFSSYLLRALDAPGARERMAASAEQYLRFGLEHPRDYRFIFMGAAEDAERLAPPAHQPEPTFQFLVDRVRECMQARVLAKGKPDEVAALIWSHVHGLVSLRLSGHLSRFGSDAAFIRFYKHAADQFIAGLGP